MWIHTAALMALSLTATAGAQSPEKSPGSGNQAKKPAKPKWPALKAVRRSLAKDRIPHLLSKDESKRRSARHLLIKWGPGVCPVLLDALTTRMKPELADKITELLDELVQPKHATVLATHFTGRNERRDGWILDKLAGYEMRELLPFFKKAAKKAKGQVSDKAWYAVARAGDRDALPFLLAKAKSRWPEENVAIRESLPPLHGRETTDWLMVKLRDGDSNGKVAALRLLGGAGTKVAVHAIGSYLDATEHHVRAGAVNALRGIMDGDPPFRNLSVFQAIDEVKKWKRRLGRHHP